MFSIYEENETLIGVLGLQHVDNVALTRNIYLRTSSQKGGIGGHLLRHLRKMVQGPILIGTWADAVWAIRSYEKHGFRIVGQDHKERLLRRHWTVPDRQLQISVVLEGPIWLESK